MFERFTVRASHVLIQADEIATRRGSEEVTPDHLLLALTDNYPSYELLQGCGVRIQLFRSDLKDALQGPKVERPSHISYGSSTMPAVPAPLDLSVRLAVALDLAKIRAQIQGRDLIDTGHLLIGVVQEDQGVASTLCKRYGITPEKLDALVRDIPASPSAQVQHGRGPNRPLLAPDNPFRALATTARQQFKGLRDASYGIDREVIIAMIADSVDDVGTRIISGSRPDTFVDLCNYSIAVADGPAGEFPLPLSGRFTTDSSMSEMAEALSESILTLGDAPNKRVAQEWLGRLKDEIVGLIPVASVERDSDSAYRRELAAVLPVHPRDGL